MGLARAARVGQQEEAGRLGRSSETLPRAVRAKTLTRGGFSPLPEIPFSIWEKLFPMDPVGGWDGIPWSSENPIIISELQVFLPIGTEWHARCR